MLPATVGKAQALEGMVAVTELHAASTYLPRPSFGITAKARDRLPLVSPSHTASCDSSDKQLPRVPGLNYLSPTMSYMEPTSLPRGSISKSLFTSFPLPNPLIIPEFYLMASICLPSMAMMWGPYLGSHLYPLNVYLSF